MFQNKIRWLTRNVKKKYYASLFSVANQKVWHCFKQAANQIVDVKKGTHPLVFIQVFYKKFLESLNSRN